LSVAKIKMILVVSRIYRLDIWRSQKADWQTGSERKTTLNLGRSSVIAHARQPSALPLQNVIHESGSEVVREFKLPSRRSCVLLVRATGTTSCIAVKSVDHISAWSWVAFHGCGREFPRKRRSAQNLIWISICDGKCQFANQYALGIVSVWWQGFTGNVCARGFHGRESPKSKLEQPLRHRWRSDLREPIPSQRRRSRMSNALNLNL